MPVNGAYIATTAQVADSVKTQFISSDISINTITDTATQNSNTLTLFNQAKAKLANMKIGFYTTVSKKYYLATNNTINIGTTITGNLTNQANAYNKDLATYATLATTNNEGTTQYLQVQYPTAANRLIYTKTFCLGGNTDTIWKVQESDDGATWNTILTQNQDTSANIYDLKIESTKKYLKFYAYHTGGTPRNVYVYEVCAFENFISTTPDAYTTTYLSVNGTSTANANDVMFQGDFGLAAVATTSTILS